MKSEEWVGRRIGSLTIEAFEGIRAYAVGRSAYFRFRCDCGNAFSAQKSNVIGKRQDCGCTRPTPKGTHLPGAWNNPLYKIWSHMLDRCSNPKNMSFKDYGARGISVCERWKTGAGGRLGFECFTADMGERPAGWTIERVQGDGNYEPGNCVWLPKGDQSKNRRGVKLVRIGDNVKTIPDWCLETGVSYWVAIRRVQRGWPPDRAVTQTPRKSPTRVA